MRRPIAALLACFLVLAVSTLDANAQTEPPPPETVDAAVTVLSAEALALPLEDVGADGASSTTLGELRGAGGLLVIFLSNTCPYVLDWADRFPQLVAQAEERGVGLAIVNSNARKRCATDSPDEMRRFASEHLAVQSGIAVSYLLDEGSQLADLLAAERTPEAFLFDGQLELIYRGPFDDHSGPFDQVEQHWLRDALGTIGTDLEPPDSRPALGCKIQRPRRRAKPSS